MAKLLVIRDGEIAWEESSPTWKANAPPDNPGLRFKRLLPTAAAMPNMQRTQYEPGHIEPPHSHPEDEIIFVLGGTIRFGRDELTFGDALFVGRDTKYSLRAGDEGAEFLRVGFGDLSAQAGA